MTGLTNRFSKSYRPGRTIIVAIGCLPPPVTGKASATLAAVRAMTEFSDDMRVVNLPSTGGLVGSAQKLAFVALATLNLLRLRILGHKVITYVPVDAGKGMWLTLAIAFSARILRVQQLLHHHSWDYIASTRLLMKWTCRLTSDSDVHILLCSRMEGGFRYRYGSSLRSATCVWDNAKLLDINLESETAPPEEDRTCLGEDRPLRIGYLGNVTIEKGIDTALALVAHLGDRVVLEVAGPIMSQEVSDLLENFSTRQGSCLTLTGPVYSEEKREFFRRQDVLLFPSRYRHEADPLTVLEALGEGLPVLATNRGCLADYLPSEWCLNEEDFVDDAAATISAWMSDPLTLDSSSLQARNIVGARHASKKVPSLIVSAIEERGVE